MNLRLAFLTTVVVALSAWVVSAQVPVEKTPILPKQPGGFPRDTGVRWQEAEAGQQTEDLVRQLRTAEGDKKEEIKTKLTDLLNKQFDLRQQRHQEEIKALEAQVRRLKGLVEKRQENRREIISKRLDQLVRDAEGLGW